jgi:ankyrin repeat protein
MREQETSVPNRRRFRPALTLLLAGVAAVSCYASSACAAVSGSPVAAAAQANDVAQVRQLIKSGADVNAPAADGTTALLYAAFDSNIDLLKTLLSAGADPNVANHFGVTPLLQASRYGDEAAMEVLLKGGADIGKAQREGETPLMAAARAGSVPAVKLLLKHGANPNTAESLWDETALMWATAEGHLDVVDALLAAHADPNLKARVSDLTKRSTRTDFPSGGFTAVMWAARDGNEALVRRLVEGGADIKTTNADGATPMMLAIINDRFDLAAKLLDLGADANDGSLYQAVEMHDATTDWRAKDGTRLRADHPNQLTALDLIKVLLDHGADPNKPYQGQMHSASMCCDTHANGTPFYRAAVAADVEALKLMIAKHADLEWAPKETEKGPRDTFGPNNVGKTPLMVAMDGGKGVGMAGGPGDIREGAEPPFREVSNRNPLDAMQVLIDAGANINAKTPAGDSALHIAAFAGKLDVVRLLAKNGADLGLKDGAGLTALQVVEKQPPRPPPPTSGALAGEKQGAQPTEVAALLRELMHGNVQANLAEGPSK